VGLAARWRRRDRPGLLGWYLLTSLGTAAYVLQGRGANVNHLMEAAAACCVLAALGLDAVRGQVLRHGRLGAPLASVLAVVCLLLGARSAVFWLQARGQLGQPDDPAAVQALFGDRRVLALDVMPVAITGRQPITCDLFMLTMLTQAGAFDPTDLAERVARRE